VPHSRIVSCTPLRTSLGTGRILVGQYAVLIDRLFQMRIYLKNRISTKPIERKYEQGAPIYDIVEEFEERGIEQSQITTGTEKLRTKGKV